MRIAILTFEGFNELDSFIASAMLNRVRHPKLEALIVCPSERVASMNGVVVQAQARLSFAREADAVLVGSGAQTRKIVRTPSVVHCVAPVGQKREYVDRALAIVKPYLAELERA